MDRLPFELFFVPTVPHWVTWKISSNKPFLRPCHDMHEGVVTRSIDVCLGKSPGQASQYPMTSKGFVVYVGGPGMVRTVDLEERSPVCVEAIEVHSLDQHDSTHELGLGGQGVAFQGYCNCVVEGMPEFRDMAVD